jgi:non-histone protein 10
MEKPLRTKRGHRKASILAELDKAAPAGATFINSNLGPQSPSSDAFSHSHADGPSQSQKTNGTGSKGPKRPGSAFDMYCAEKRPALSQDESVNNVDEELARGWKDLSQDLKDEYEAKYVEELDKYRKAKEESAAAHADRPEGEANNGETGTPAVQDEDVEMANSDTEAEPAGTEDKTEE